MNAYSVNVQLLNDDCLIALKTLADNSIDSVVTDPPYGLNFMGKEWDRLGDTSADFTNLDKPHISQESFPMKKSRGRPICETNGKAQQDWHLMWAKECLRVLKPGGFLLAFGGSRTYHRMACAIEDAGFEVRDMIEWVYGSGFPKSLNIGKAVDKLGGQSLSWFIDYILKVADEKGISRKELTMLFPSKNGNPTGWLWNKQKTQGITLEQYHKIKEFLQLPFADIIECEREIVGRGKAGLTAGTIANFAGEKEFDLTKGTSEWEGWGTALKPAHEPIVVARKPLSEKTVAENVLKWGVGGINIDACRIKYIGKTDPRTFGGKWKTDKAAQNVYEGGYAGENQEVSPLGRFPANFIHDGSEEVLELFPDSNGCQPHKINSKNDKYDGWGSITNKNGEMVGYEGKGSAARFFYCAKASSKERNYGLEEMPDKPAFDYGSIKKSVGRHGENTPRKNHHPTVKPINLMCYLIRLVTPKKGVVLDPFLGSGTTALACIDCGNDFIGIEKNKEYFEIAKARIKRRNDGKEN